MIYTDIFSQNSIFKTVDFRIWDFSDSKYAYENVDFRINEDYETVVLPNKAAFEGNLKNQLANILNTDVSKIQDLRTWSGSIEVSFNLVADNQLDASTQAAALQQFQTMVGSGQLSLTDLDGNLLDVPSQCVNNCPVEIIGNIVYS